MPFGGALGRALLAWLGRDTRSPRHAARAQQLPLLCPGCRRMVRELPTGYGGLAVFDWPTRPAASVAFGARYVMRADGRVVNSLDVAQWAGGVSAVLTLHNCSGARRVVG